MTRWSSTRARLVSGLLPAIVATFAVVAAITDKEGSGPGVAIVIAAVGALVAIRASRTELRLDPDVLVVRNPVRTYRVPYGDVLRVTEGWRDLLSQNTDRHIVGAPVLFVTRQDKPDLEAYATWWLPEAERNAARETLLQMVYTVRPELTADDLADAYETTPDDLVDRLNALRGPR